MTDLKESAKKQDTLLGRLTAPFLPEDFGSDPELHFRARVVFVLSTLVGVVGVVYAALTMVVIDEPLISVATFVACGSIGLTPLLMRRGYSFAVLGNWMTLWACGLFYLGATLGPQVLIWQVIYIILLVLIAGWKSAVAWLVVMSGVTVGFYMHFASSVPEGEVIEIYPHELLFEMSLVVGMFVVVTLLLVASQRIKNWALDEVRRQESQTRAILEAAPDGIVTVTDDGRIGEVNPAAEKLFGRHSDNIEQAPLASLVPDISAGPVAGAKQQDSTSPPQSPSTDRDTAPPEHPLQRWVGDTHEAEAMSRDGSRFPAELSVTAIEDDERYVAIVRDITERKEAQKQLEQARDEAVEANEAKSQFLANISHELRTPLNAIIGYSELVGEDLEMIDEEMMRDDVGKIESAGRHLLELINEILDLSKVEAGKMELFVEEIDVETVIEEIGDTLKPVIEDNGNTLKIDIDDAPETMRADRMKLRQILINLLSNASKFTENGLVRIHAFTEERGDEKFGVFEVIDRGIGIPDDKLDELFEAFSQAEASTTRDFGGTGLGLTLCKHFSEMMGGDIGVESTVGEGSTFRVKIPVDVERAQQRDDDDREADNTGELADNASAEAADDADRVLVIDDDPTVHQLVTRFLADEGFAVETTTGGEGVLETIRQFQPDIITLDVLMPEIDGWNILEQLNDDKELRDIPVIMLTILDERNMGFSLGATDYLTKPVDPQQLVDVLKTNVEYGGDGPILIVEDDEDTRTIMRRTIEEAGFQARCAVDGHQAIEMLDGEVEPSAMLLDLMMPKLDGFEVLEKMRTDSAMSKIPVIVVSAADLSAEERQMLERNVEEVLQKGDFRKQRLVEELQQALDEAPSQHPDTAEATSEMV